MDAVTALALVAVGGVAGVVNTVAGGGSFVTVAALLWTGVPAAVANGTNRVGVLVQAAFAARTFRSEAVDGGGELLPQVVVSGLGSLAGAGLAVVLPQEALEAAISVCMLGVVLVALVRPSRWSEPSAPSAWRWPALLVVGLYGGFLQAGVGLLLLPCLVRLGGLDPVRANARKSLLVGTLTVPALITFAATGVVDWGVGIVLAAGSAAGAVVGAKLTTRLGARFVWATLLVVVALTALRTLLQVDLLERR
jgi:uncharacterized membrane protein YfcA